MKVLDSNTYLTKEEPKPSGKFQLPRHRPTAPPSDIGKTSFKSYSTYS